MYIKPIIEVIEFTDEDVVMNVVASSGDFSPPPPPPPAPEVPWVNNPLPQPGIQDGQDSEFIS